MNGYTSLASNRGWRNKIGRVNTQIKIYFILGINYTAPKLVVLLTGKQNQFVVESDATRGKYLIGCYFETSTGKFKAQCRDSNGKVVNLGRYETQESAHYTWLSFKYKQAVILASKQTDVMVADALINRYTRENYPHGTTHMYATGNPYNDVGESQPAESVPTPTSQTIVDF